MSSESYAEVTAHSAKTARAAEDKLGALGRCPALRYMPMGKMPVPLLGKTDAAPAKIFAENALSAQDFVDRPGRVFSDQRLAILRRLLQGG